MRTPDRDPPKPLSLNEFADRFGEPGGAPAPGRGPRNNGEQFTDAERAWLAAVDARRRKLKKSCLNACDYLALLLDLGYRPPPPGGRT